jgi:hypothetical protein
MGRSHLKSASFCLAQIVEFDFATRVANILSVQSCGSFRREVRRRRKYSGFT